MAGVRAAVAASALVVALMSCAGPAGAEVHSARACSASWVWGSARVTVRHTRAVRCRRALRIAKRAVVFREHHGFPNRFCHRGWCWRFGASREVAPGLTVETFHGARGARRIRGTESVS